MKAISVSPSDAVPISKTKQADVIICAGALFTSFQMLLHGRILELLEGGRKEHGKVIVHLPNSLILRFQTKTEKYVSLENVFKEHVFDWTIRSIELLTAVVTDPDNYGQTGHIRIHFTGQLSTAILGYHGSMPHEEELRYFVDDLKSLIKQFRAKFPTVLAVVRYLSPQISLAKIRRMGGMNDLYLRLITLLPILFGKSNFPKKHRLTTSSYFRKKYLDILNLFMFKLQSKILPMGLPLPM
jgi:hypothetical protein